MDEHFKKIITEEEMKKAWDEYFKDGWRYGETPDKQNCFCNGYVHGFRAAVEWAIERTNDASNNNSNNS